MRKISVFFVMVFGLTNVIAQIPEKISYQAVVRDNADALVVNQSIGLRISLLQEDPSGDAVYVETVSTSTNVNGLITIQIGEGDVQLGDFSLINWSSSTYYIQVEIDVTGGTNYTLTGLSPLSSVPYAFHSKTADSITGSISEFDPIFSSSVASQLTLSDVANWNNKQNTVIAGEGITIVSDTISASEQKPTMLYSRPIGVTTNVRHEWVLTNVHIDVLENSNYMIFYKFSISNLIGNTISLPSDRFIEVELIYTNDGETVVLDNFQFVADIEALANGTSWHFRPTERISDMTLRNLEAGGSIGLRIGVFTNNIEPRPTNSYSIGAIEVYAIKVN